MSKRIDFSTLSSLNPKKKKKTFEDQTIYPHFVKILTPKVEKEIGPHSDSKTGADQFT